MDLNREQIAILDHTAHRAAGGLYCGDSPDMQNLVQAGLMVSAGRKSFVPDEYFRMTGKGREALRSANNVIARSEETMAISDQEREGGIEEEPGQVTLTYEPYVHKGMRLNITNMVRFQFTRRDASLIQEFIEHLAEAGNAFYAGNLREVDNFFQLYCLDKGRNGE